MTDQNREKKIRENLQEFLRSIGYEDDLHEQIQSLQKEREKLIEALRWYADISNYEKEHVSRFGTVVIPVGTIYEDAGQRARDTIKAVGVEVDANENPK